MTFLADNLAQGFSDAWVRQVLELAVSSLLAFSLVAIRLSGLLTISPVFGHPDIPLQVRVLLVVALSFLVTPPLMGTDGRATFQRLDRNHDQRLTPDEIPAHFQGHAERLRRDAGKPDEAPLAITEFHLALPAPNTLLDYAWLAVGEFSLGFALGLGVLTLMSGLQMAGQLIDQQTGASLGEVFNPELDASGSLTGELLHLLGTVVFLLVGGHGLVITALVDTFQTIPLGYAGLSVPALDLLRDLVQQSLVLAIQVSAPLLVTMALVALAMGFLGHTIPQINVLVIGFPVRTAVGLVLFGLILSSMGHLLSERLPATIDRMQHVLEGK